MRRRWVALIVATSCVASVLVIVGVDCLLLNARINHVAIDHPQHQNGSTFVVVGSDSRSGNLPAGLSPLVGSTQAVPGQRADVVEVVHFQRSRISVLTLPRDLLVSPRPFVLERLALTLSGGPQQLVDALCRTTGISTSHLVIVEFGAFVGIVDALGGIVVDLPHPIRDPRSSLLIESAGRQRIDGMTALALVRSRNPSWLIDRKWVAQPNGAIERSDWTGRVFHAVAVALAHNLWDPLAVQRVAWSGAGSLTTDQSTGILDLMKLANSTNVPTVVSARQVPGSLAVAPDKATYRSLAKAGYKSGCSP